MIPPSVTFAGQEIIPGMRAAPMTGDPAILTLEGNCPIVISAPHAGAPETTPSGAKLFGERENDPDPNVSGSLVTTDDRHTLPIAFALVRTLSSLGFVPYAVINLVSRFFMDLNRRWERQQMWRAPDGLISRPGDETKTAAEFPRVAEFEAFRQSYYQDYHDTLQRFTESQHPDGWLFDVHGNNLQPGRTLQIVTTLGYTARRDFVYDNRANLHGFLIDGGFAVEPEAADPGQESVDVSANGNAEMNLISGELYGAQAPPAQRANLPPSGPVTPGPQRHRLHGVQFEMDGSIRPFGASPEALESVGINLALAIYRCLLGNGVVQRTPSPRDGRHAMTSYTLLG